MKQIVGFLIVLGAYCCASADGYRILSINASPSRSHVIVQEALAMELARRGHHVTMATPYPLKKTPENYRQIGLPADNWAKGIMAKVMEDQSMLGMLTNLPKMNKIMMDAANNSINHPDVKRIIQEESFDLFMTGLLGDFVLGVAYQLGIPSMVVVPNGAFATVNDMVGNPSPLATIPNVMMGVSSPMGFADRMKNVLGWVTESGFGWFWTRLSEQYYYSNFPRDGFPTYTQVRRNVSLVLINQHFTKASARPYVQSLVEVGGLQVKPTPDPLPKDLQEWIDGAEHGVIFFSMGTNLLASTIPTEKLNAIVNTFRKLKQRIIWKWDSDDLPNKPANIMLRQWLPQDDILAHKNVKLFVTHGGLGGIAEAQYHGVPLVGMPMFGDQPFNMLKVVQEGWAVTVPFGELTEASFSAAVNEVLSNSSYSDIVKQLSELYRDRPMSAMDTAVYWTEYIIRHKGARHMRYPGVDLNFIQLYMLDVFAVLGATAFVIFKILSFICVRCCCRRKAPKQKWN